VALALVAYGTYRYRVNQADLLQEQAAEQAFEPVFDKLDEAIAEEAVYDLDKTIRVIHEIDLALQEQDSLDEYLMRLSMQDYRDVAPEVLEARKELLGILMDLYAKQVEQEDQQAMWELTSELLLSTFSVVEVSGQIDPLSPKGKVGVDRAQARQLLEDLKERQRRHRELVREINETETELFDALFTYSDVYFRYVEEWDQLSILRDRAYLAAHNGDWEATLASAELAVERAPLEREAHLLEALARIERGNPEDDQRTRALLDQYLHDHPDSTAPAFLLLGVLEQRAGNDKAALLAFQQSAAYYPKQAEALTDMLDPYRMRGFLRDSREGSFILELYQSTMLGAGYFSPDLQMARMQFEAGDSDAGRQKVLDHFARRRTQKQWDFIISDIGFCHDILGPHFWEIFAEETYLDLDVSPAMLSDSIVLAVHNRSHRTVHNATLVLALHFTDTFPDDYEAIVVEPSVPAVMSHDETAFGTVEVSVDIGGTEKRSADIVHHRAILISDEAVVWVDTDEFRIAEAEAFRERRQTQQATGSAPSEHPDAERHPSFQNTALALLEGAAKQASLEVDSRFGADDVLVELPRELAILRPLFQLRHGEEVFTAADNLIDGDRIMLRFGGVHNFDDGADGNLDLVLASPFGDAVLSWTPGDDLTWRFEGVTPQD